jgi:hypothetical protein
MDGEKVMMNIQSGKYYNLGQVGGRIWDLLTDPVPVRLLISKLLQEYDVEQAECEAQVHAFLEQLYREGLIRLEEEQDDEISKQA